MALIKCRECGKECSDTAAACPNCGAVIKAKTGCFTQIIAALFGGIILFVIVLFFSSASNKQTISKPLPPSVASVFLNEPMKIGPFEITVDRVLESKKIGKYKPLNTYLQVFVTIKNTSDTDANAPHFSVKNTKIGTYCFQDDRMILDDVKGSIVSAEFVKAGENKKGFIAMNCADYVRSAKNPSANSKPADFKMFVQDKLNSKSAADIYFWKRPQL